MAKHLYGILREGGQGRWGRTGLGGSEVYTVSQRGLAAAVSESPPVRPDAIPHEELALLVQSHQSVLEKIAAGSTVLPAKFGTAAKDENELREILEKGRNEFLQALENAQEKVEYAVVGLWADLNSQLRKIAEQEALRPSQESLAGLPQAKIGEAKLELGRRLQSSLHCRSHKIKEEILAVLKDQTESCRLREVMDDRMILNAAFWLDRSLQDAFQARFQAIALKFSGEVNLRRAGPLPPYSFFLVEVKKADPLLLEAGRRLFGLSKGAAPLELQRRYRALAREQHPDRHPGDPEAAPRFERMRAAYQALLEHGRQEIHVTISGPARPLLANSPQGLGERRTAAPRTGDLR